MTCRDRRRPIHLGFCAAVVCVGMAGAQSSVQSDDGFHAAVQAQISHLHAVGIDAAVAHRLIAEEGAMVLDTRTPEEFAVSHLPGARFVKFGITEALFGPRLPINLPTDRPIVVYCTIGWRSGKVTQALEARGVKRVFNLVGGIIAWQRAGFALVDPAGNPTKLIHPYDRNWARFVPPEAQAGLKK